MKKPGLLLLFSLFISTVFAQNLNSVQRLIAANDYVAARHQVDSLLAIPSQQQQAAPWFYKARIYTELVRRHETTNTVLLHDALKAFRRYQELDPQNTLMALDNNVGLFQLYDLSYNNGVEHYNREEYALAFKYFSNALETEEYIYKKKFSFNGKQFPALDTQLISLTAFSAYLSNNEVEAIPYFERLAELKLGGAEYKSVYTLLYQYHQKHNDATRAGKYLVTGRKLFDDEEYWIKLELGNPKDLKERLNRYEEMTKKYPSSFVLHRYYATDLFNYVYAGEKQGDHTHRQERLERILLKLVSLDTTAAIAFYMMSQHLLNQVFELEDSYQSMTATTDAGEIKKKELRNKIVMKNDELARYAEKALKLYTLQETITENDKANCRQILNNLVDIYAQKKDNEKVEYYRGMMKEF